MPDRADNFPGAKTSIRKIGVHQIEKNREGMRSGCARPVRVFMGPYRRKLHGVVVVVKEYNALLLALIGNTKIVDMKVGYGLVMRVPGNDVDRHDSRRRRNGVAGWRLLRRQRHSDQRQSGH